MKNIHECDLNLLVVLSELLRTPSVRTVASRLGRTPSAISHALARLRRLLDDPLFVRVGTRLEPTARAQALRPRLQQALGDLSEVLASRPEFEPTTAERRFVVACADYHELVLWPHLAEALRERAPGLDLTSINAGDGVEQAVTDGPADLGIAVDPRDRPGLRQRALFTERFVVVMRREHPLAGRRLTAKRFAQADHALIAPRGTPGSRVDRELGDRGLSRRICLQTAHFVTAPVIVARTDLLLTIPERVARVFAPQLDLVIARPPVPIPEFTVVMLWAEPNDRDPAHAWLRAQIVEAARSNRTSPG